MSGARRSFVRPIRLADTAAGVSREHIGVKTAVACVFKYKILPSADSVYLNTSWVRIRLVEWLRYESLNQLSGSFHCCRVRE